MKVDGSLKSLLQGVSQQPPRDRLPGQCTLMTNMTADPVAGLSRRPPSDAIKELLVDNDVRYWYDFTTQDGNDYVMAITGAGGLGVYDLNGNQRPHTAPDGAVYLTPDGVYSAVTVENTTYIANANVVPAMAVDTKRFANAGLLSKPMGIIQVLGGQYGRTYSVKIDGVFVGSYRGPDGTNSDGANAQSHAPYIRTTHIAQRLKEAMVGPVPGTNPIINEGGNANGAEQLFTGLLGNPALWSVVQVDDVLLIVRENNQVPFSLEVSDDQGNINIKAMTDTVPDISDLPRIAPNNYVVRVARETDPEEDLWFEFIVEGADPGIGGGYGRTGYWQETVKPGLQYNLNRFTMPWILDYTPSTQSFVFRVGQWLPRRVGTEITNPLPSFIGNPIRDISTFQSRLVFLAGPNVITSRSNRYLDFWIGSADALVDSDPIDVSSTAAQATIFRAAVPHNKDLVVFSNKGQFVMFGRQALTPMNATLVLTTAFEAELRAKPVATGRNVFFATNYGRYTGMREFYTEGVADINDTRPVTDHVKEYIQGKVIKMAATSNHNHLVCTADADLKYLYLYQYIWAESDKIQSAWSRWAINSDIIHMFFREAVLYIVTREGTAYSLSRMSLDIENEPGFNFPVYLDFKFDVLNVNTQLIVPNNLYGHHQPVLAFMQGPGCPNPGMPVKWTAFDTATNTVTLAEDMQGGRVIGGLRFRSEYWPTMPYVKDSDGTVIHNAKLKPREFLISTYETGEISGYKKSKYGNGPITTYRGRRVSYPDNLVGAPTITYEDTFVLPFRDDTKYADIALFTESMYPMALLDIEYTGQYLKKGRRITQGG